MRLWQLLKNGGSEDSGLYWHEYPLQLRREINDLLDTVQREKDSGYWILDAEARRLFEGLNAHFEETRVETNAFGGIKGQVTGHQQGPDITRKA